MAYTYVEPVGGIFVLARDEVRYLLSDTAPAAPFSLTDAEIEFELAQVSQNRRLAAANAAFKMATRYGAEAVSSKSSGDLSITRQFGSQRDQYTALARQLRSGYSTGAYGGPILTGEVITPQFTVGMWDQPDEPDQIED